MICQYQKPHNLQSVNLEKKIENNIPNAFKRFYRIKAEKLTQTEAEKWRKQPNKKGNHKI